MFRQCWTLLKFDVLIGILHEFPRKIGTVFFTQSKSNVILLCDEEKIIFTFLREIGQYVSFLFRPSEHVSVPFRFFVTNTSPRLIITCIECPSLSHGTLPRFAADAISLHTSVLGTRRIRVSRDPASSASPYRPSITKRKRKRRKNPSRLSRSFVFIHARVFVKCAARALFARVFFFPLLSLLLLRVLFRNRSPRPTRKNLNNTRQSLGRETDELSVAAAARSIKGCPLPRRVSLLPLSPVAASVDYHLNVGFVTYVFGF